MGKIKEGLGKKGQDSGKEGKNVGKRVGDRKEEEDPGKEKGLQCWLQF